ncbi:phosphatidate cytidylyltransferase [Cribrihabitans marinus]|uniref:Phosphatidate cytidylyltransferase n=1 Tax=Cribrihabitans marinus TaxID=1227549 RepID=A0A1H6QU60_9RHOB|nr:phosphatidate cytidylyltransferase [Cribrihabitans marinus]GGH19084.1 phosphatidate cytidylyltransferase [Cribrihabitans marinus]SEI43737.1 phosphatidate cytidylyltransferase [Cribrihabitans marinus]
MNAGGRWSDLAARLVSGIVLAAVAAVELWLGGIWFELFIAAATGIMIWELLRMLAPDRSGVAVQLALLTGAAVLASYHVPPVARLPLLLAPVLVGMGRIARHRALFGVFAFWISVAGLGFILVRETHGLIWMLWLIAVVVATDVAGYFCGKGLGGPKLWPRVSPKKTWSGTGGGWLAAAAVGLIFGPQTGVGLALVLVSVLAAMASQAGDIAESALKRHVGVKDSSNLIPGHGGFLDRFDGMMGAAVFVLATGPIWLPGGA